MAGETVLLYNCSGPQWSKLRQVFVMQKLRMKAVEPASMAFPRPGAGGQRRTPPEWREEFSDPMLVFCSLTGPQLDRLLGAMKRAKLPPIPSRRCSPHQPGLDLPAACGRSCAGNIRPCSERQGK